MRHATVYAILLASLGCRTLPTPDDFGTADVATPPTDALVADVPVAPTPVVCPERGWLPMTLDVDGVKQLTCAADSPVWGILALKPEQLQDRGDGTVLAGTTQLVWQIHAASEALSWQEALTHCDTLTLAGHADWRMPTFTELQSLVDFEASNPAIDPPFDATPADIFWTATTSPFFVPAKVGGAAWSIRFDNGVTQPEPRSNRHRIRCVRSDAAPVAPPSPRFVQETLGAIVDRQTGLEWDQGAAADNYTPLKAFGFCQHLNSKGAGGWHLSNLRELSSLIDFNHSYPAFDPESGIHDGAPTQASNFPSDPPFSHWEIDFHTGAISVADNDQGAHIHCARAACGNGVCGLGETVADCPADCALPVEIAAGTVLLGCDPTQDTACDHDALPRTSVQVGAFAMQPTEVAVRDWHACAQAGVCVELDNELKPGQTWPVLARRPLNYVTWADARIYCRDWLGKGWDLPTEAQWELAARGPGQPRDYPWGSSAPDCTRANFTPGGDVLDLVNKCTEAAHCGCGAQLPIEVGTQSLGDTPDGVHDLAGNVAEWLLPDAASVASGPYVARGGSFADGPGWLKATARRLTDGAAQARVGFRCARSGL